MRFSVLIFGWFFGWMILTVLSLLLCGEFLKHIDLRKFSWRLNMILTFATKHLLIINKDNLYLHLSVGLNFKLLYNVIFLSLPGQSNNPSVRMANFQLDEYLWNPYFLNNAKLKLKTSNHVQTSFRKT